MKHTNIQVDEITFPAIEIQANKVDENVKDNSVVYTIADLSLWECIGNYCMDGQDWANRIDEQIYFYAHKPIWSFKTEKSLIKYLKKYCV